ncbi:Glyoxylase, beta-lactamase superfamily II [Hydrobacter penzbergensis]|uniref:Glyoxylase, beta-lactamase superfamily II n=1 Tax=Hydrobacter penzbergensis TaxID=1235997 RepID=A0A8X8LCC3_9BACT|nr:MBL fold metallo-hydrolase [Hydrobacter penzbergensis]SDW15178.1 Glyoxylase, beta-lactamase superfamily II [Hydrobacter penzbergensis]
MQIKQFEDKNLAQFSYAVLSDCEKKIILIDPARNTQPYLDYATENEAQIVGVIETHPHADFVSSHLELHQSTGATIYTGKLVDALYPHQTFDEGDSIQVGKVKLSAIHTPGHSPDSISVLLEHNGKQKAVFTGDTLFIGDCGRPDLREGAGKIQSKREELARQMYHSLREKLMTLNDDVVVYPAHGAGTLCGKNLSKESSSAIGREKQSNWSLQPVTEEEFVNNLLSDQPFIPHYFSFDVELNRKGAAPLQESISKIKMSDSGNDAAGLDKALWIVDVRKEEHFKEGHLPHSINIMEDGKFETWLGSIIKPGEKFYLAGESREQLQRMMLRAAAIGYETAIAEALIVRDGPEKEAELDVNIFKEQKANYTIIDVRNTSEVKAGKIFPGSLPIPLAELRERVAEIPTNKPIVVHCAGGYRSAAASSLIHSTLNEKARVFDLSDAVKNFMKTS